MDVPPGRSCSGGGRPVSFAWSLNSIGARRVPPYCSHAAVFAAQVCTLVRGEDDTWTNCLRHSALRWLI